MEQDNRPLEPYATKENTGRKIPETTFVSSRLDTEQERNKIDEIRQVYDAVWKHVEPAVMTSFEDVTHNKWKSGIKERGIHATFSANKRSYWHGDGYNTMDLQCANQEPKTEQNGSPEWKNTYEIMGSHLHTLGFAIQSSEDKTYMRERFGNRIDSALLENYTVSNKDTEDKKNRFLKDIYANVTSIAAAEHSGKFSPEQIAQWIDDRRKENNGAVLAFVDTLSNEDKRAIIDKTHREPLEKKNVEEPKEKPLHKKISTPLKRFFIRKK